MAQKVCPNKTVKTNRKRVAESKSNDFEIVNGVLVKYNGKNPVTVIPSRVESIGDFAFFGCEFLRSVKIPDSVKSIGNGAFCYCAGLTEITIPDGVKSIGKNAFAYCNLLKKINTGNSENLPFFGRKLEDIPAWFRTKSEKNMKRKSGGYLTYLIDSSSNATLFKEIYKDCFWYKR